MASSAMDENAMLTVRVDISILNFLSPSNYSVFSSVPSVSSVAPCLI